LRLAFAGNLRQRRVIAFGDNVFQPFQSSTQSGNLQFNRRNPRVDFLRRTLGGKAAVK